MICSWLLFLPLCAACGAVILERSGGQHAVMHAVQSVRSPPPSIAIKHRGIVASWHCALRIAYTVQSRRRSTWEVSNIRAWGCGGCYCLLQMSPSDEDVLASVPPVTGCHEISNEEDLRD